MRNDILEYYYQPLVTALPSSDYSIEVRYYHNDNKRGYYRVLSPKNRKVYLHTITAVQTFLDTLYLLKAA